MSQFGKNFDSCQRSLDNQSPPDEETADCEYMGHTRSAKIPLDDNGLATCKECGDLFNEEEDRKRAAGVQQKERDNAIERLLEA